MGSPNEKVWPGYNNLPAVKNMLSQNTNFAVYPTSRLKPTFLNRTTENGVLMLQGLLTYDPKKRLTAEAALKHPYFKEMPKPIDPSMFPTWPAKSEQMHIRSNEAGRVPVTATVTSTSKAKATSTATKTAAGTGASTSDGPLASSVASGSKTKNINRKKADYSSNMLVSGIITGNKKNSSESGFVLHGDLERHHHKSMLDSNCESRSTGEEGGFKLKF